MLEDMICWKTNCDEGVGSNPTFDIHMLLGKTGAKVDNIYYNYVMMMGA